MYFPTRKFCIELHVNFCRQLLIFQNPNRYYLFQKSYPPNRLQIQSLGLLHLQHQANSRKTSNKAEKSKEKIPTWVFFEAKESFKKICEEKERGNENVSVQTFGDMIVATICDINAIYQTRTMKEVTELIMSIKLDMTTRIFILPIISVDIYYCSF